MTMRSAAASQSSGAGVTSPGVLAYLEGLRPDLDPVLAEIRQRGSDDRVPIVHDEVGMLLELLVRSHRPRHVVEFGTAIGYSTAWMARGLRPGACLTSFELDPGRHALASDYLARVGSAGEVRLLLGDALERMHEVQGDIQLVFLDATKGEYQAYLDWALERMSEGGLALVDNALMGGHVAGAGGSGSWSEADVAGQRAFNESFVADERFATAVVLPIGDGLGVGVRR